MRDTIMCKVCERAASVIEAMENLYTLDDWKALFLESRLVEHDPEMTSVILMDDRNVWMNVIGLIAAHWFIKHQIPIFSAAATVSQHLVYLAVSEHDDKDSSDKDSNGKADS
jgi:hypothetical protein